jgi:hypothetical protein
MTNKILTLRTTGRLTCTWVPTGNPRNPLACVWTETAARNSSTAAPSSNANSRRVPLCA